MNNVRKRHKKISVSVCCCIALMLALLSAGAVRAYAGISLSVICEEDSYKTSLSGAAWWTDSSSGASASGSVISFDGKATDSHFSLVKRIDNLASSGIEECFILEASFKITQLGSSTKFGFAFGLERARNAPASAGSSFLYFTNPSGSTLSFGIDTYNSSGAKTEVKTPTAGVSYGLAMNTEFKVILRVDTDGSAKLTFNNNPEIAVSGVSTGGYAGFGQVRQLVGTNAKAQISKLRLEAYENQTPENAHGYESFDYNCFNSRMFMTNSEPGVFTPSYLAVENKALLFNNTADAFIATQYRYSNAAVSFSLPYLQRKPVYGQGGELLKTVSSAFAVIFGAANNDASDIDSRVYVEFRPVGATPVKQGKATEIVVKSKREVMISALLPEKFNLWGDSAENQNIMLRVSLTDGKIAVGMKYGNENGFTPVLSYSSDYTPTGYIQIASAGCISNANGGNLAKESIWQGNFSIDDLSVINNDMNPVLIKVPFVNNLDPVPDDYVYVDPWDPSDLIGAQ